MQSNSVQGAKANQGNNQEQPKTNQGGGEEQPKGKHKPKAMILMLVVIAAACGIIYWLMQHHRDNPNLIRVSGRIEGYETNVGAKIAGRVEAISNREGEEVKLGQPLVRLSDEDIQAQLRGAKAKYLASEQQVHEAEAQLEVSKENVNQAKLNVTQAKEDASGRIDQAAANIATSQAQLGQAISQEVQAKADLDLAQIRIKRYDDLVVKGAVTQDEDDQAHSTYKASLAAVDARHDAVIAARKQVIAAQAALVQAKSNALNPPIRVSQQAANVRTVTQSEASLQQAKENVKDAKAQIDQIQANIQYLNINSPIHGVVTARTVEPGAVVAAGQTVISLIDLDTVFLRAYVPDSEIGRVRLGQHVDVYYDSAPKTAVKGKIIQIDPQASFTPENIYFRDDRVKQVFGVKVQINNPNNYAKPGMPADADIDTTADSGKDDADRARERNVYADPNARSNKEPTELNPEPGTVQTTTTLTTTTHKGL
ncbi:MAG TPA: efflux RND transporter periplasmic adaptor subunit [Planktothrix sp.]